MGGLVDGTSTSTVAIGLVAVLLVFAVVTFAFLGRARLAREARDGAVSRERALRRQFEAVM